MDETWLLEMSTDSETVLPHSSLHLQEIEQQNTAIRRQIIKRDDQ